MAGKVIDLDTPEGVCEHVKTLPSENLREIAARPLVIGPVSNITLVMAAAMELVLRGEKPPV
jgi:hypothetical protein